MNMKTFATSTFFRKLLVVVFLATPLLMTLRLSHGIWLEDFTIQNILLYTTTILLMVLVHMFVLSELSKQFMMGRLKESMGNRYKATQKITHLRPVLTTLPDVIKHETVMVEKYTVMRCYRTIDRTLKKAPFIFSVTLILHLFLVVSHVMVFSSFNGTWFDLMVAIMSSTLIACQVVSMTIISRGWYSKYPTEVFITPLSDVVRLDTKIPVLSTTMKK